MRYFFYLAGQAWRRRKKEYAYFLIGIAAATAFLTGLFALHDSVQQMYYRDVCQNEGSYHILLRDLDVDAYRKLYNMDCVTAIGYSSVEYGCSLGDYRLEVENYNAYGLDSTPIRLEQGSLPVNPSEIALSTQIMVDGEYIGNVYEPGDRISITKADGTRQEYVLSGILNDFDVARTPDDAFRAVGFADGLRAGQFYNVYAELEKDQAYHHILEIADMLGIPSDEIAEGSRSYNLENAPLVINDVVLEYDRAGFFDTYHSQLLVLMNILIFVVLLASVVLLANRNLIMIRRRRKELAVMKMQGFQNAQLLFLVSAENLVPGLLGILLGGGIGLLLGLLMIRVVEWCRVSSLENISLSVADSGILYVGLWMLLVLLAVNLIPVLAIWRLSPMEAFGTDATRKRRSELGKHVVMTASIGLTCSVLIFILYFLQTASLELEPDGNAQYYLLTDTNMKLMDEEYLAEVFPEAEEIEVHWIDVPEWEMVLNGFEGDWRNPEVYDHLDELYQPVYFPDENTTIVTVEALSREGYETWRASRADQELPDYDELLAGNGCILLDNSFYEENGEMVAARILYHTQVGDELHYEYTQGEGSFTVMGITEEESCLPGTANIGLVIPEESYLALFPEPYRVLILLNAADEDIRALGERVSRNAVRYGYTPTDNVEQVQEARDTNVITLIGFVLTAVFLGVTCVISVFQIKAADILARRRDFEILQCIGMTKGQMYRKLAGEDLWYTGSGLIAGAILFGIINRFYRFGEGFAFWKAAVSIAAVFLLVFAVCACCGYAESKDIGTGVEEQ